MADSVYRVTELVGTSTQSWEAAAKAAIQTASKTLRDLRVAEVVRQDVPIEQKMTSCVHALETGVGGSMLALGDDGLDQLLPNKVLNGRAEPRAGGAGHAVRRPRGLEVRVVREMVAGILVIVPRCGHELVFALEVAQVPRHHARHLATPLDRQGSALDDGVLTADHQERVPHLGRLPPSFYTSLVLSVARARAHTPIGKFGGAFKDVPAVTRGGPE